MDPFSIAGMVTSIGGSLAGAIGSAISNSKMRKSIADGRRENQAWYNRKSAEQYTQRSDAQAILKKQRELLDQQYKRSRATNAIAGGTDESLAKQQAAANDAMSNTMTNMAGQADAYKTNIENQYRQTEAQYREMEAKADAQQAANIANAAGTAVKAGVALIDNTPKAETEAPAAPLSQPLAVGKTVEQAFVNKPIIDVNNPEKKLN